MQLAKPKDRRTWRGGPGALVATFLLAALGCTPEAEELAAYQAAEEYPGGGSGGGRTPCFDEEGSAYPTWYEDPLCSDGNPETRDYCDALHVCRNEWDCGPVNPADPQSQADASLRCMDELFPAQPSEHDLCKYYTCVKYGPQLQSWGKCVLGYQASGFGCYSGGYGCQYGTCNGSGTCVHYNRSSGSACCRDALPNAGEGTCNSSGTCVGKPLSQQITHEVPVSGYVTDRMMTKWLYNQFKDDAWTTSGISASASACIPTGGTVLQKAQCLAQGVTSTGTCNNLPYCTKQTAAFNLRMHLPKIVLEGNGGPSQGGKIKFHTSLYFRSSTHPQFDRNIPIRLTVNVPSGSVSAAKVHAMLLEVQQEINDALAQLGAIAQDLKNQIIARLGPDITLPNITPIVVKIIPEDLLLHAPFYFGKRYNFRNDSTQDDATFMLNDLTLSWSIEQATASGTPGRLKLVLTPRLALCTF